MTTRSTHDTLDITQEIVPQTLDQTASPGGLASGNIDTLGFDSLQLALIMGDIDEMGASPVGAAQIDIKVEHAADDGTGSPDTYAAVASADIDGFTVSTVGHLSTSPADDRDVLRFGYIGNRRFVRVTLEPQGLSNGGPVALIAVKGHAHLSPTS